MKFNKTLEKVKQNTTNQKYIFKVTYIRFYTVNIEHFIK